MANTTYTPTWKKHEKDLRHPDTKTQVEAADKFIDEREHELKTNPQAKRWEEGRRASWAKGKASWVKAREEAYQAPLKAFIADLHKGGVFDTPIQVMPGYVLVHLDPRAETTESGIVLADTMAGSEPNRGTIVSVGGPLTHLYKQVQAPVALEDRVMFKKGAGLDMQVAGTDCRLMNWDELLCKEVDG